MQKFKKMLFESSFNEEAKASWDDAEVYQTLFHYSPYTRK